MDSPKPVDQLIQDLKGNLSVPLWPTAGMALGACRSGTYRAAKSGHIPINQIGRKLTVPTAWLRQKLGLDLEARDAA